MQPTVPARRRLGRALGAMCLSLAACVIHSPAASPARAADGPQLKEDIVKKITEALPAKAPAAPKKPRKVLVFTLATGFVHSSIPYGAKAWQLMGEKTGAYEATISADPEMFAPEALAPFDAVVMQSTTGELFLPKEKKLEQLPPEEKEHAQKLRQSLLDFVRGGKGLAGLHAASDCSYRWAEYGDMIGGYFNGHPIGKGVLKLDDPGSPINACFNGQGFPYSDETYNFKEPYSRTKLHILTSLDPVKGDVSKGTRQKIDQDYAISWIHEYGKGRVFYCALGHGEAIYSNPTLLQHFLAGLQYALGDLEADAQPSGPLAGAGPAAPGAAPQK